MNWNYPIAAVSAVLIAGSAWAQPSAQPTDAQIAHIVYTADQIDVTAGRQALAKSKNAEVRAFAQEMVRDHTAVNEQALALAKRLGVTPQANPTSAALASAATAKQAELARLNGAAFDRAYVENEIAYHKTVNAALSGTLILSARNADLKQLLATGLTLFQEHLAHAERLAKQLR